METCSVVFARKHYLLYFRFEEEEKCLLRSYTIKLPRRTYRIPCVTRVGVL